MIAVTRSTVAIAEAARHVYGRHHRPAWDRVPAFLADPVRRIAGKHRPDRATASASLIIYMAAERAS